MNKKNRIKNKAGNSGWRRCPSGQLSKFAQRTQAEQNVLQRRKFLLQASTLGAFVVAGGTFVVAGRTVASLFHKKDVAAEADEFIRLTCSDVIKLLGQYKKGELEDSITAKIEVHLAKCPKCEKMLAEV